MRPASALPMRAMTALLPEGAPGRFGLECGGIEQRLPAPGAGAVRRAPVDYAGALAVALHCLDQIPAVLLLPGGRRPVAAALVHGAGIVGVRRLHEHDRTVTEQALVGVHRRLDVR